MKIVLISQWFYPSTTPRALRTTELAKELACRGYDVIVYSLLGKYDYCSFMRQTNIKIKQLGISKWGNINSDGDCSHNIFVRLINHFWGRLLWLPHRELIPMIKNAIKNEGDIDCLITIAYPHIIHYATAKSDLIHVKNWIADCGDPFTLNPYGHYPKYFKKYEYLWCDKCNYITIPIEGAKEGYYPQYMDKIRIIPQGFNMKNNKLAIYKQNQVLTFVFAGLAYRNLRDPSKFLGYLSSIDLEFRFIVYGSFDIFEEYKEKLGDKLIYKGKVPREELLYELSKMDFLINIRNVSGVQQPSKLIDYKIANRPILTISSNFDEEEKNNFNEFINGNYEHQQIVENVEQYNIVNVANEFVKLIK